MSMQQELSEKITKFLHQLWNGIWYCEFEKLGPVELRLTEKMYNASHQYKILEHLQFGNIFVNAYITI